MKDVRENQSRSISAALTITGWIMRGAIREDDNTRDTPDSDEPGGVYNRVFNHFYDPTLGGGGLSRSGVAIGTAAADWALTAGAAGINGRHNDFKITDAREAMWRALTLKASNGAGGFNDDVAPSNWSDATKEQRRNAYWATVFRALGDAVHLVQDMGQPQHTRNDPHAGFGCLFDECLGGHDSFFEAYIAARTVRQPRFTLRDDFSTTTIAVKPAELEIDAYTTPSLPTYRAYFADTASGAGLASYSNQGFYSVGTNIGSGTRYASPSPTGAGLADLVIGPDQLKNANGDPVPGSITLKTGTVHDAVTASDATAVKLSTVGLWDQFLRQKNQQPSATLTWYNYDDQARLLLPRAIGYSAGLLNFFFRGRLSVTLPDEGVFGIVDHSVVKSAAAGEGFKVIKAKVSNQTPPAGTTAQDMSGGVVVAVMKFHRNTCYTEDLQGEWGAPETKASKGELVFESPEAGGCRSAEEEIVVSPPLSPISLSAGAEPQTVQFDFSATPIPINATDVKLQVVYRGPLGDEQDAVVVETVDINEPYFTAYTNATDNLLCVANQWYVRDAQGHFPASVGSYGSTVMDDVKIAYQPRDATPEQDPLIQIVVPSDPTKSTLEPNQSIRFSVLTPLGTKWGFHWKQDTLDNWIDHNIFPGDLTTLANQVYVASAGAGQPPTLTKRARTVYKARNAYTAAGKLFYGGDGSECDIATLPADPNPAPQLIPLRIMKAPFNQ